MTARLLPWIVAGSAMGFVLGIADALALLIGARFMFLHGQELFFTLMWTLGLTTGTGALCFTILGIAVHGANSILEKVTIWRHPIARIIFVTCLLFFPLFFLLRHLTSGPQASLIPHRNEIVWGVSLFCSLGISALLVYVPIWASRNRLLSLPIALIAVGSALVLNIIDLFVLVRLYPAFHYALTLLSFLTGALGLLVFLSPRKGFIKPNHVIGAFCVATCVGVGSLLIFYRAQNPRYVVQEKTAHVADILALTSFIFSPNAFPNTEGDEGEIQTDTPPTYANFITRPGANVFLLSVDAMRYDRLAISGSTRPITPNLDSLAGQSIVFKRAYTAIPHTSHAICSIMTGKFTHQLRNIPGIPPAHETWAEIMHRFRYNTAAFFTRAIFFIDKNQFEPYIRSSYGFAYRKVEYNLPAMKRANQLIAYLQENRGQNSPVFAWAHFFDPHEPYDKACGRFGQRPVDRYDCEISKVDSAIGKIVSFVDEAYPNSIIIVTADHGEEFNEHGGLYHGTTLYDEQVRVPLLIRIPDTAHRIVETPVSLVDLPGTIMSILDIPKPARMRSRDLTSLITEELPDLDVFADVQGKTMVVHGNHKLICELKTDLCRLYDLKSDPRETHSVLDRELEIAKNLKQKLVSWLKSHARHELRPIPKADGERGWPKAIQAALAGDDFAAPDLARLLSKNTEPLLRQKAAELLYRMRERTEPVAIPSAKSELDPVVAAWLLLMEMSKPNGPRDQKLFEKIRSALAPTGDPSNEVVLAGFEMGFISDTGDLLAVVGDGAADLEQQRRAIRIIGEAGRAAEISPTTVPFLMDMIDNYQLTLDIALTLANLGDRRATPILIKRLKRERFLERKSQIIHALAKLGGPGWERAIAEEMLLEEPPGPILPEILAPRKIPASGRKIRLSDKKTSVLLYPVNKKTTIVPKLNHVTRIFVGTKGEADGGTITVFCNGRKVGTLPILTGTQEGLIQTQNCDRKDRLGPKLNFQLSFGHPDSTVFALGIVGE